MSEALEIPVQRRSGRGPGRTVSGIGRGPTRPTRPHLTLVHGGAPAVRALPRRGAEAPGTYDPDEEGGSRRDRLTRSHRPDAARRLARARRRRRVYWRRRLAVAVGLLALVALLVVVVGRGADADLAQPEIAGYATIEPGDTLWDVAVEHAPAGTDPRAYVERLRQVNELDGAGVPAWTVLLLPAR